MADNESGRATPMLELIQRMAGDDKATRRRAAGEVQRRWNAAAEVQGQAWTAFHPPGWSHRGAEPAPPEPVDIPYNHAAIDDARQLLSGMTLINELWILQRAGVAPADLFLERDGPARVYEVLNAEYDLEQTEPGDDQLLVEGAEYLARCVERTLFGESARILADHLRLAGNMRSDLLQECVELTMLAHAELDSAWTLQSFLADPAGSGYYLPQPAGPRNPYEQIAIALGRQGNPPTRADIDASHAETRAELGAEVGRVIRDDPPKKAPELHGMPHAKLVSMHAEMDDFANFLQAALGLRRLAEDHVVRLDGRAVAPDMRGWVLETLTNRARLPDLEVGTLTLAGAQVTFTVDRRGVVAQADVAGTRKEFATDNLRAVLAVLESPDALTTIAKMRAGVDQIGRSLAEQHAGPAARTPRRIDPHRGHANHGGPRLGRERRLR